MSLNKSHLWIDVLHGAVAAVVAVFFVWADFLETSDKTNRAAEEALYNIIAPLNSEPLPQSPVVVVLIDKDDLAAQKLPNGDPWTWPLDGDQHDQLLAALSEYDPAAVFYDISFAQKRAGFDNFSRRIGQVAGASQPMSSDIKCDADAATDVPVLVAHDPVRARARVELCASGARGVATGWEDMGAGYPMRVPFPKDNPIAIIPTAALELFKIWCSKNPTYKTCTKIPGGDRVMSIQWGSGVAPGQTQILRVEGPCAVPQSGGLTPLIRVADRVVDALRKVFDQKVKTEFPCPQTLTIPARQILSGTDFDKLHDAIKGHVVLIGTAGLVGLSDVVYSPVHGQLPGVYVHAQALDNLLRYGDGFVEQLPKPSLFSERMAFYYVIMWAFLTLCFRLGRFSLSGAVSFAELVDGPTMAMSKALGRAVRGLGFVLVLGFLALGLPAVVAAVMLNGLSWSPMDWIAIVIAMSIVLIHITWRSIGQILAELGVALPPTRAFTRWLLHQLRD